MTWSIQLGRKELAELSQVQTVGDLIDHLEQQAALASCCLSQIQINELRIDEEDERTLSGVPISQVDTVVARGEPASQLVGEARVEAGRLASNMVLQSLGLSQEIRGSGLGSGHSSQLVDLLESLQTLALLLKRAPTLMEPDLQDFEARSVRLLEEMVTAFQGRDERLVADILEYEVTEALRPWIPDSHPQPRTSPP